MLGKVIKSTGSWYVVLDEQGRQWECRLRGKIRLDGIRSTNPVAVGDNVEFEQEPGKDTGVIKKIEPPSPGLGLLCASAKRQEGAGVVALSLLSLLWNRCRVKWAP